VSADISKVFITSPELITTFFPKQQRMIALSAVLARLGYRKSGGGAPDQAREPRTRLRDIFGKGNCFLEIQTRAWKSEKRVNPKIVSCRRETGIPLVATNDCHYLTHADARARSPALHPDGKTMSDAGIE